MSEKRRGLGRGLGALIPTGLDGQRPTGAERPVDVFFPDPKREAPVTDSVATGIDEGTRTAEDLSTVAAGSIAASSTLTAPSSTLDTPGSAAVAEGGSVATATMTRERPVGVPDANGWGAGDQQTNGAAGPVDDDGTGLLPVPGARFAELPVLSIRPNPRQPRTVFDEDALDELVGSIREIGVLQPIVVRDAGDGYELIMGERRWRATQLAGLATVPAIIRDTDDGDLLRDALLENLHRSQLNPLEEAAAYQQLLDDFGCTHEELATRISRSRPQISNTLRLLKLPPLVQRRVAAGVLSAGHARALLGLPDAAAQERLAQRIVAEGLSVRAVEEIVSLGGDPEQPARRAAPVAGQRNEALDNLAARLSDRFETRVKVSLGKSRGRLTVEFASVQDLNRILASLAPEDPGLLKG
ncbi:ParB/RepB/Spo0J family partition protein [Cellulomonas sp. McL0617]|uniref:ParB/RepB/Spo0J family partition protein n=1 Tax=Cellulomonas sp. McL0617 TaxID=3415675 RepID=UPI003CF07841